MKRISLLMLVLSQPSSLSESCGGTLDVSSSHPVNVSSPGFETHSYPVNILCEWKLTNLQNRGMLMHFLEVSIRPSFGCALDGVRVYEGAQELGRWCRGRPGQALRTRGPQLTIRFHSGPLSSFPFKGFFVSVQDLPPQRRAPCGVHSRRGGRVSGGRPSRPGSWPWQGALHRRGAHICGAVLISPSWLLTAAHCFSQFGNDGIWTVHLGKHLIDAVESSEQGRTIRKLTVHPSFNTTSKEGDIALVQLNRDVELSPRVRPVCLPPWIARLPPKTKAYVTGWGEARTQQLHEVAVPLIPKEQCRKSYEGSLNVTDSMLCAGYKGHDSSRGDSGGGLVVERGHRWFIIGLVSAGYGTRSGIYTNIPYFKPWIADCIKVG